ncbi:hypothetical protein BKA66DRAFT_568886 [Pyrenochaeta sp. MPI-SDFR-AT-0127]|nr:hypothetical protein BKA66DRAFT_568886 [Pyrenochaeta sp. MPI-SDFR-AT-0127]
MAPTTAPLTIPPAAASIPNLLLNYNPRSIPNDKPAIIDGPSGKTVFTYATFRNAVKHFAVYLRDEVGVKPGDVVAFYSGTRVYFPVCVHGVLAIGATVTALNPLYQAKEITHALNLAKPSHIFAEPTLVPSLQSGLAASKLPSSLTIHVWDDMVTPPPGLQSNIRPVPIWSITSRSSSSVETFRPHPINPDTTPAFLTFSSGTSGLSKGVILSHTNVVATCFQQLGRLHDELYTSTTVTVLVVPFFHILGLGGFCVQYVCHAVPIVVFPRFDVHELIKAIETHRITHINIVPPIGVALLNAKEEMLQGDNGSRRDLSSLKCLMNAAAPLKLNLADALSKRYGCTLTQWYGMTEMSPSVSSQREDEVDGGARGSCGKMNPGIEAKTVDEEGRETTGSIPGELLLRGPNLMLGYVGADEARDPDGWFATGDIGYFDKNGFLFIVDRKKEMIKVKAHQVAPAELESILLSHPDVRDAGVCSIYSDAEASEFPIAYVALKNTSNLDSKTTEKLRLDIRQHVDQQVAHYKRLKGGLHFLPAIPRNPSGKVLRRLLPANLEKTTQTQQTVLQSRL